MESKRAARRSIFAAIVLGLIAGWGCAPAETQQPATVEAAPITKPVLMPAPPPASAAPAVATLHTGMSEADLQRELAKLKDLPAADSHSVPQTLEQTPPSSAQTAGSAAADPVKVWVNTNSGVYHSPGTRWYGATKEGEYMTEAEAGRRGYRPSQNGQ